MDSFNPILSMENTSGNHSLDRWPADPCAFDKHEWLEAKLILISICGTTVAILGILGNLITIIVLTRPSMRSPNNLYLTFLAVFDTLLLLAAIFLYSLEYIFEYSDDLPLYNFWINIVRCGFALSHVAQTGSVYITVAVTFERYLAVLYPKRAKVMCTHDRTALTIALVIAFAIMFNSTKYFEVEIIQNENCTGFSAQRLMPSALLNNHIYQTVHSLWLTQMVMVFIPFVVLFFVNTAIVFKVRRSLKRLSWIQRGKKRNQLKEKSRDATKVLLVIVMVFLVCNSWGFIITLLENLYSEKILREWWPEFYAFSREAVNFLAIVNSSINFIIYMIFGKDFRRELVSVWGCRGIVMFPATDRFTAESLMGSPQRRRTSMFVRYLNLIRNPQPGEKKSSKENSQEKDPSTDNLRALAVSIMSRNKLNDTRPDFGGVQDKAGPGRGTWKKATISSADYNGDFVSIGDDSTIVMNGDRDGHIWQANGNANRKHSSPMSPWRRIMAGKGCLCSAHANGQQPPSRKDSKELKCKVEKGQRNSIVGNKFSDSEPLAPFLLGMLVTSASHVRQAGLESAMKNFEEEDIWV